MSHSNKIVLCFGHDETLRLTRQWLLEHAGFSVITVATEAEFRQHICTSAVGLVVFCHTLKPAECEQSAAFMQEHCPGARCLALYASQPGYTLEGDHVSLGIGDGPAVFIQTVQRMLPQQPAGKSLNGLVAH